MGRGETLLLILATRLEMFRATSLARWRALLKAAWLALVVRKDTRGFYNSFSAEYDALVGGQPAAADASRFLGEYLQQQQARVRAFLDLGCGTGLYSRHLLALGGTLHGVDFSGPQLVQARTKGLAMILVQGDVLALPYRDSSFEVVTSFEVLAHFPGQEAAFFKEAYRVLAPGGVFLVDPVVSVKRQAREEPGLARSIGIAARMMLLRLTKIRAWTHMPTHEALMSALEGARFQPEAHERHYARDWIFLVGRKPEQG